MPTWLSPVRVRSRAPAFPRALAHLSRGLLRWGRGWRYWAVRAAAFASVGASVRRSTAQPLDSRGLVDDRGGAHWPEPNSNVHSSAGNAGSAFLVADQEEADCARVLIGRGSADLRSESRLHWIEPPASWVRPERSPSSPRSTSSGRASRASARIRAATDEGSKRPIGCSRSWARRGAQRR